MCIYIGYKCRWICLPVLADRHTHLQKTLKSVTETMSFAEGSLLHIPWKCFGIIATL